MSDNLLTTVLFDIHSELGAKISQFGGFLMPIQYRSIIEEHQATRRAATIFDTCHMGEFRVCGPSALEDLERLITSDLAILKQGRCRNGFFCDENGGVIDDLIVYRMSEDEFMIVVNASTQATDFEWIKAHVSSGTTIENISAQTAKLDLQGPLSPRILQSMVDTELRNMRPYDHRRMKIDGIEVLVSRTGYTGEIGFEIYANSEKAPILWQMLTARGAIPAGLGARDTLRLEMCYPLYGYELSAKRNAAESGFDKLFSRNKEYIGASAIRDTQRHHDLLSAILLDSKRSCRGGDFVHSDKGDVIGIVTSGSYSPSLDRGIALAYLKKEYAIAGVKILIRSQRAELSGVVVERPFYKDGTSKKDIVDFL